MQFDVHEEMMSVIHLDVQVDPQVSVETEPLVSRYLALNV
jgi:hypothetical protein